jgi:hypothetical protein
LMPREVARVREARRPKHPQEWNKRETIEFLASLSCPSFSLTGAQLCSLKVEEITARLGGGEEGRAQRVYDALQHAAAQGDVARGAVSALSRLSHGSAPAASRHTNMTYREPTIENLIVALETDNPQAWAACSETCAEEAEAWTPALRGLREASMSLLKRGKTVHKREATLLEEGHTNAAESLEELKGKLTSLEGCLETLPGQEGESPALLSFPPPPCWEELPRAQMGVKTAELACQACQALLHPVLELDPETGAVGKLLLPSQACRLRESGEALQVAWKEAQAAYASRQEAMKEKANRFEQCRAGMEKACNAVIDASRDRVDRYLERLALLEASSPEALPSSLSSEVLGWVEEYESTKQAHEDLLRMMGRGSVAR